jgi:hypothetical protein
MNLEERCTMDRGQIARLCSPYLAGGKKTESWEIWELEIDGPEVRATARMTEYLLSPADGNRFHLSFITAMEMVSQLTIVYLHHKAGLTEKSREVWVSESSNRFVKPVRNPDRIDLQMQVSKLKRRGDTFFSIADYRVTDDEGGLLHYWGKAFLV